MALQGRLLLNNADYAPFNLYGVGLFMAFLMEMFIINHDLCKARGWVEVVADGSNRCL